ncbi:unnamed protein product [Sphagnum balticum]
MAYLGTAERVGDYRGGNVSRPSPSPPPPAAAAPATAAGAGVGDLSRKLGSLEMGSNSQEPNQAHELVDIIEAAETTIRTQMEENEQLRASLRVAEWELQSFKLDQIKQGAAQGYQFSLQSTQRPNQGNRPSLLMEGQRGSPGMLPSSEYQNGMRPVTPTRDASSAAHHNGMSNGDSNGLVTKGSNRSGQTHGAPIIDTGSFSQLSNASSRSVSPHGRRRDNGTDLHRVSSQGQGFSSDLTDYNNQLAYRTQDMMVRSSRMPEDGDNQRQLQSRLGDANIKEAQLISEKRILERRVAELRLAYDQQQKGLVDAASQALSYRQEILEENIRLTYALQVAEQERGFYVQSLMPLLAEFDLQPAVSDAHSMVSHVKILVQKLRSELELMENKLKDSQYYRQPYQPPYQPAAAYNPPPQSPPFQVSPSLADSRAIVPHESVVSRGTEAFSYLDGDEAPSNGVQNHERDTDFERPEAAPRSPPQLPTLAEEPTSPSLEEGDPLPGIVGLRIVGDAVLSGRLTACGHSINGTALCIFQWVRHYQDGTAAYIEGAAQPEYTITADDCDSMVAIECVPMDECGRRGDLVTVMANDGNWISRDPMMQDQIDSFIANGHASFEVQLLVYETAEPATLLLRRSTYEIRRNSARRLVSEKYTPEVSIKIPVGQLIQCVITSHDGRANFLELRDPRTRDTAVLTFRAFHNAAIDEQKKKTRKKWLRG